MKRICQISSARMAWMFSMVAAAATGCGKSPASTAETTGAEAAAKLLQALAEPQGGDKTKNEPSAAKTTSLASVPLAGPFKGYTMNAPAGAVYNADVVKVGDGSEFSLGLQKTKFDLKREKQGLVRGLTDVKILSEDANSFVYDFASIGRNHGFRANVTVGSKTFGCASELGFFSRENVDEMLRACLSLAKK